MKAASRDRPTGSTLADVRVTLVKHPPLLLWALYLFTFPIYVFSSGLPQPGDWLILLLAPVALSQWNGRLGRQGAATFRALLGFIGYVVLINVLWSLIMNEWGPKRGFIFAALFYIYNGLVFLIVLALHRRYGDRLLYVTGKLVLFTLVVQVAVTLVFGSGGRGSGLFNSPNQLGYYALLSASLLILLQQRRLIATLEVTIGNLAALYLTLVSASKAAMVSIVLLMLVASTLRVRTMLLVGVGFMALLVVAEPMFDALSSAMNRIESDESHSFIEERGYDRILNHPEYWVTGAGEGGYYRFRDTTVIGDHEIHSSIGTLFFCYGIVGTVLFGLVIWSAYRGSGIRTWMLLLPSLAYGMTHQGLRFTLFWVLVALVIALRESEPLTPRARAG